MFSMTIRTLKPLDKLLCFLNFLAFSISFRESAKNLEQLQRFSILIKRCRQILLSISILSLAVSKSTDSAEIHVKQLCVYAISV